MVSLGDFARIASLCVGFGLLLDSLGLLAKFEFPARASSKASLKGGGRVWSVFGCHDTILKKAP